MKKFLLLSLLFLTGGIFVFGQELAPNQNPNYQQSRTKYMGFADSLTSYQSTTIQDTYKAIDYLADKAEAKAVRRAFRNKLKLMRAERNYYGNSYYRHNQYPSWYSPYNYDRYNRGYRNSSPVYPWLIPGLWRY